uniref:Uncharacterized protein PF11_0207-like n=1 Tax=Diabrotica virgifera virgifera TaxID=50390 RepID=A0A6P7FFW2_DIAVI
MNMTNEEIMQFKEIIKELINETTAEIMKETKELINEVKEMNKIYREEIKQLKEENLKIKQEIKELRVKMIKIEEIEEKLEVADRKDRKNNIIISGLEIPNATEKEMEDNVKHFFENQLQIKISVPKIKEIKEKTYLIKVENFAQKLEIMKNKAKLTRGKYNQTSSEDFLTKDYNISFKTPKSDTCAKCDEFQININHSKEIGDNEQLKELETSKELHLRKAKAARDVLEKAVEESKENDVHVITFDLQQALPTPKLTTGPCFYKKNFGVIILVSIAATSQKMATFFFGTNPLLNEDPMKLLVA